MKKLTVNQKEIIKQLVIAFEKINETPVPKTNGLIDIARIKETITLRDKFISECKVENDIYARIVDKQVKADAEKLRSDLNELGLDVWYKNNGLCTHFFNIIKLGDKVETDRLLEGIYYKEDTAIIKQGFDQVITINKTFKISCAGGHSYSGVIYFKTIEELVKNGEFKKRLEGYYESYLKNK